MSTHADRFRLAAARLTAVVDAVPADRWDSPSPCEGWTAADVLGHIVSSELDFLGQRGLPVPEVNTAAPLSAWPAVRDAMQAVLDDPGVARTGFDGYFGPTTVEDTIDRFYTFDLLIHRWDIGHAAGLDSQAAFDAEELSALQAATDGFPEEVMRMPGLFGPAVEPPAGADEQTRLLAHLGRTV